MVNQMELEHRLRPAIAMIELIFALVVMGITLLSVPLVVNESIKSSTVAMQQEAIAAAGSQLGLILTQKWDARDGNETGRSGIVNVVGGAAALDIAFRDLNSSYSTRTFNTLVGYTDATPAAALGQEGPFFDDIDDFHDQNMTLTLYGTESEMLANNKGEYLDMTITMANRVVYGVDNTPNYANNPVVFNNPFTSAATSTNIKLVSVQLTSNTGISEHDKSIFLSAFACNVGTASATTRPLP